MQKFCEIRSRRGAILRLLPLSTIVLPLAVSAESSKSADQQSPTPAFSRNSGDTSPGTAAPSSTTSGSTEDSGVSSSTAAPSFYGASSPNTTSSIGIPGFGALAGGVQASAPANYPLQWGPFSAHPHLNYGFTYSSGTLIAPGRPTSTAVNSISPGLSILSKHLTLDYTPTITDYVKGPYQDSVNHSANLSAGFGYNDWSFRLGQSYAKASYPLVETGTQTETESFGTSASASWNYNEKMFFDFSLSQQIQNNVGFQSSRQWSTMEWANYRLTRALSIGAGLGGGYTDVDIGSDATFEQIQTRLDWHPSQRLSLDLNGGIEIRQFLNTPDSGSLINPIMGASIFYQLFDHTSLRLSANRSVNPSLFTGEIVESTVISGGITQRLLQYLNLGVSAGYNNSNYKTTFRFFGQTFQSVRDDSYTFVSTSLGTTFLKRGSASVGYTHTENESNLGGYTYASDQFSVQLGYRF